MNAPKQEGSEALSELEAFESWAKERGNRLDKFGSALGIWAYENDETQAAFVAWQARAALSAAPQSDGWLPIESAPKDEVVMLAAEFDRPGDWRMKCGYYQTESGDWRVWGASWKPTMWRPMPTPPKMTKTQGQNHGE